MNKQLKDMKYWDVRMLTCQFCPNLRRVPVMGPQCKVCGCFMKVKTRVPDATCPEGRWRV